MKKTLLLILLISPFISKSQQSNISNRSNNIYQRSFNNSTAYSYSIGYKILSFEEFPRILDQTDNNALRRSALNGIILKYNNKQISYRLAGSFYSDRITFQNGCDECEEIEGRLKDTHIKLGFEKNFTYGTIQPYFGIDLGIKRSIFKGDVQSTFQTLNSEQEYDVKTEKNGLSVSPLLGIKLNIIDHFSITAESTIDVFYSYERQERANNANPGSRTLHKYYKWEYLLKPLGMLSLQYNFGAIY